MKKNLGKYKEMLYTYSIVKSCITISTIYMLILSVEPVDAGWQDWCRMTGLVV